MGLRQEAEAISGIFEYIGTSVLCESHRPLLAKLVAGLLTPPVYLIARLVVNIPPVSTSRIYRESLTLLK